LNKILSVSNNKIDVALVKAFARGITGKSVGGYLAIGGGGAKDQSSGEEGGNHNNSPFFTFF